MYILYICTYICYIFRMSIDNLRTSQFCQNPFYLELWFMSGISLSHAVFKKVLAHNFLPKSGAIEL